MHRKEFLFIIIITFIVVVIWVIADIIHTWPSVPLNPNLQTVLEPLDPTFDREVINRLKNTTPNEVIVQNAPIPSPQISPGPQSSPVPSPTVLAPDQNEATSEAGI